MRNGLFQISFPMIVKLYHEQIVCFQNNNKMNQSRDFSHRPFTNPSEPFLVKALESWLAEGHPQPSPKSLSRVSELSK